MVSKRFLLYCTASSLPLESRSEHAWHLCVIYTRLETSARAEKKEAWYLEILTR